MRQGPNPRRPRGRPGRKHSHPRSNTFESNGPEVKVRGNAQQVVEKYLALARDATSAGDRITAESYFQHAEHYYRVMTANGGPDNRHPQGGRPHGEGTAQPDGAGPEGPALDGFAGAGPPNGGAAPAAEEPPPEPPNQG